MKYKIGTLLIANDPLFVRDIDHEDLDVNEGESFIILDIREGSYNNFRLIHTNTGSISEWSISNIEDCFYSPE